jgi:hypothetical protein
MLLCDVCPGIQICKPATIAIRAEVGFTRLRFLRTCVDSIQNQLWWKLILDLAVDDFHNNLC